ncbi:hypothetical protein BS17DRAFT_775065 [Gyrodon lividus]|nr:hypothetical protein BS17DRAFT_775065 [Gyrodon lividus]
MAHNPDAIPNQRWFFVEALLMIDIALEAHSASLEAQLSPTSVDDAAEQEDRRIYEVLVVLMPERQHTLDQFVLKFDTLVWLDAEGLLRMKTGRRFEIPFLTLGATGRAVQGLDEAVVEECIQRNIDEIDQGIATACHTISISV